MNRRSRRRSQSQRGRLSGNTKARNREFTGRCWEDAALVLRNRRLVRLSPHKFLKVKFDGLGRELM